MRVNYCKRIQSVIFGWILTHGSKMKMFRLFLAVIVVQTLTVVAQSFGVHGRSTLLRRKRLVTSNNSTCSTQQLKSPFEGAILKTPQEGNSSSFHHGDKVEFVCKDGYRQVGELKSFICQGDGKWNKSTSNPSGKTFTLRYTTLEKFHSLDVNKFKSVEPPRQ